MKLPYGYTPGYVEADPCGDFPWSQNPGVTPCPAGSDGHVVVARSRSGNIYYFVNVAGEGGARRVCITAGRSGCRSNGTW